MINQDPAVYAKNLNESVARLMRQARDDVHTRWSGAELALGERVYAALLSERLLCLLDQHRGTTDPQVVVDLLHLGRAWVIDEVHSNFGGRPRRDPLSAEAGPSL